MGKIMKSLRHQRQLIDIGRSTKTAVFFSYFTKELLSDLQYRFKIDIDADQAVGDIITTIKDYLNPN